MYATKRLDLVEEIHETSVPDPYRWLEDVESDAVKEWVEKQNDVARAFLDPLVSRQTLSARLAELYSRPHAGPRWRRGDNWFQLRSDGQQELEVLYVMSSEDDEGRILLDPNNLTDDKSVSVGQLEVSWDGTLLAWSAVEAGSSWSTIHFRDVATGKDRDESIQWAKFGLAWAPDGGSLFYTTFPRPREGERFQASSQFQRTIRHRLGTPQEDDEIVFAPEDHPRWLVSGLSATNDGRYLVLEVHEGTDAETHLHVLDFERPDSGIVQVTNGDAMYSVIGSRGDSLYVRTDLDAPRGRIIEIDLSRPEPENWIEILPEGEGSMAALGRTQADTLAGDFLIVTDMVHSFERLRLINFRTKEAREVALPEQGAVSLAPNLAGDDRVYLQIGRFAAPPVGGYLDVPSGQVTLVEPAEFADTTTEQLFATSPDGTRVPLVIVRLSEVRADGARPALMTGYGGFGLNCTADYYRSWQSARAWVEQGGIFVSTNLRGGSEYGLDWHYAGRREHKPNVFADFEACARHLVSTGWTRHSRIAINGPSNGGLLVAATMVRYPDSFGACIPEVGVLDMLRYHLVTSGIFWAGEYGTADHAKDFKYLLDYSPVHQVHEGTHYPATLVMASFNDDHVVPWHSFKFAAALQAAQGGPAPVLLRTETKIGHGSGKPKSMQVADRSDVLAFALRAFELAEQNDAVAGANAN